jgi:hypothetical protein
MCGLVGVITKLKNGFTKQQSEIFDNLLFVDQLRGKDSTGIFLVTNDGTMDMAKEASNATDFRTRPEYTRLLTKSISRGAALIGHNRAATKGSIIDENAHPFVVDNRITLVHNGTLWGDHKKLADTEVDSHAIAHVIHENGDNVEAALKLLTGAYALIWHDYLNKTLNIVRNKERPLHWMETDDCWIWASEANMLHWIAMRFDLKLTTKPVALPEDTLTKFSWTDEGWEPDSITLDLTPPEPAWKGNYLPWNGDIAELGEDNYSEYTHKPPKESSSVKRMVDLEEILGSQYLCHMSIGQFESATGVVRMNDCHAVVCAEMVEIDANDPNSGYYLYGTLEKEPDLLVKMFVGDKYPIDLLLDWTVNERRVLMKIISKRWTPYRDPDRRQGTGDGYCMLIADGTFAIKELVKDNEGATV